MSRIYHQLRPKKTRGPDVAPSVSLLIFMRCHDNVQSVTFQSSPECRTDTTIRAGTVYIHQMSHIYTILMIDELSVSFLVKRELAIFINVNCE